MTIQRDFCLNLFILIAFNFFGSYAVADDQITVVTENWYPFNYLDKNGNIVGKSTDIVKKILSNANIDYSIDIYPWKRSMNLARTRPNVLIYSILRTPIREKLFHWICPISSKVKHQVYKLSSRKDIVVKSEEDIKNYSLSLTRGTFPHQYMQSLGLVDGVNLQVTSENDINVKMLIKGRVDLIVEVESAIYSMLMAQGLKPDYITPLITISLNNNPDNCMAISKQTPIALVERIRQSHNIIINKLELN